MLTKNELDEILDLTDEAFQARVGDALKKIVSVRALFTLTVCVAVCVVLASIYIFVAWNRNATQDQHIIVLRGQLRALEQSAGLREEVEETQDMIKAIAGELGVAVEEK